MLNIKDSNLERPNPEVFIWFDVFQQMRKNQSPGAGNLWGIIYNLLWPSLVMWQYSSDFCIDCHVQSFCIPSGRVGMFLKLSAQLFRFLLLYFPTFHSSAWSHEIIWQFLIPFLLSLPFHHHQERKSPKEVQRKKKWLLSKLSGLAIGIFSIFMTWFLISLAVSGL